MATATDTRMPPRRGIRGKTGGIRGNERMAGWLLVAPVVVILGLFMVLPILMALWVSLTGWNGQGSPFARGVPFVGAENYTNLFVRDGLARLDFMTSIRNNLYYVALQVTLQTTLALGLALVVNNRVLRGRGFFRTVFYFPSVTSSVAISVVFLFMFANGGAINAILSWFGIRGPQWFSDPRGVLHIVLGGLGVDNNAPPGTLTGHGVFGLSWWDWLAGPSVAMCAIIAPALVTLTILSFQASWNELPHTLVAVQDPQYFTLPRGLADLVSGSLGAGTQYPLKLGAALLATIPVAIIFVIFQRYFVRDANDGADKG